MKKKFALLCLLVSFALYGCKKDDTPGPGGGYQGRIHQLPPAGFTFPHLYYQQNRTSDFRAWIGAKEVTSQYKYKDFFRTMDPALPDFKINLTDANTIELLDSANQVIGIANYFFANDTLFTYDAASPSDSEDPFGKGNYSGFTVYSTALFITGLDEEHMPNTLVRVENNRVSTYQSASAYAAYYGFTQVDTLAYYNSSVTLK